MILKFLGTGTSMGVPTLGCDCSVCQSEDPRDFRLRCSSLLSINNTKILIDAGPDIRQQFLRYDIKTFDSLLITHAHYDHVVGIDELRPLSYQNPISLFADKRAIKGIKRFFPYLFTLFPIKGLTRLDIKKIKAGEAFYINEIKIEPLLVMHGKFPITGYKINNFAYVTDIKTLPEESIKMIKGIDTLVLGCLQERQHATHINRKEALDLIEKINPRICYLIHMSHELSHKDWEKALPKHIHPAYDGLEITIPD